MPSNYDNLSKKRNGFIDITVKDTDTSNKLNTINFPFALNTKTYTVQALAEDIGTTSVYRISADGENNSSIKIAKTIASLPVWVRIFGY